ncbi:hypothetical protein NTE_00812 [Candidatus Nitrososphaera evergladensis SR1]|jgi:hypothetical protein|uniref:Uncharacterized protein n=2 Tax=Nitrososphaera TaxID=497726 RepID=A0A075MP08_9ARCH|nr:hypothetical protein NTE_00812 [Candidatus Nitrososphaera evergladensis SR1]
MIISASQHILSIDENILAVCLMDSNFRILEAASKQAFDKKFKIPDKLKKGSGDYAALVFATARLSEETFGKVECIVVDYDMAKTMLLPIQGRGYVGIVVNPSTSTDYITLKVSATIEPNQDIENYV